MVANAGDVAAVNAMIAGLRGTGKPFIYTSGTGVLGNTGEIIHDEDTPVVPSELPAVKALQQRLDTEKTVLGAAGVSGVVLRPPNVCGRGDGRAVFHTGAQSGLRTQDIATALSR